jgi:hypothetical protein
MNGYLAYIIPIDSGNAPTHPIAPGGPPPYPSHPIPPSVWPNPPGQGPGNPPGTWGGDAPWPGYATPPIAPGGQPPGIWGGRPPNYVDIGGPGPQPGPSHPIAPGGRPPGIWGGANEPFPTPPIFIPPGMPPATQPEGPIDWKTAWSPQTGWIVVGIPEAPHPAPAT